MRISYSQLAQAVSNYTRSPSSFDPLFTAALPPSWLVDKSALMTAHKADLLKRAASGEPCPVARHPLYKRLRNYMMPTHSTYDPEFVVALTKIRPDWVVPRGRVIKDRLLAMASAGHPKPKHHGIEGRLADMLWCYTREGHKCYDPAFKQQILTLRPDWAIKPHRRAS